MIDLLKQLVLRLHNCNGILDSGHVGLLSSLINLLVVLLCELWVEKQLHSSISRIAALCYLLKINRFVLTVSTQKCNNLAQEEGLLCSPDLLLDLGHHLMSLTLFVRQLL